SDQRSIPGTSARLDGIYRDLLARVERIPGVQSASLARTAPLAPISLGTRLTIPSGGEVETRILTIYPKYFTTMGLSIARGRDFSEDDLRPDAPLVALVNETFVRRVLEGRDTQGPAAVTLSGQRIEIIGVVKDSRYPDLRRPTPPILIAGIL